MDSQIEKTETGMNTESVDSVVFTFNVILKYWKKSSRSFEAKLTAEHCFSEDAFVKHIKEVSEVKSSHCLEEIWVLQKASPLERKIEWIKEINGRIKLHVPDSYKEFLLKKSETRGSKMFEDPSYEE